MIDRLFRAVERVIDRLFPYWDEDDDDRLLREWKPDPAKSIMVRGDANDPDGDTANYNKEYEEVGWDGIKARLRAEGHGDDQKGYVYVKPKENQE